MRTILVRGSEAGKETTGDAVYYRCINKDSMGSRTSDSSLNFALVTFLIRLDIPDTMYGKRPPYPFFHNIR